MDVNGHVSGCLDVSAIQRMSVDPFFKCQRVVGFAIVLRWWAGELMSMGMRVGHICTPSSSIGSPSSGCVRPRWAPTANICTPWPSTPPTPPTADHHESTSSSALMPSLGPNHDMVMPSSICHYLSWHGHALIMPQRHDMVGAIRLQSSQPFVLLTARSNQHQLHWPKQLQHL